jgi:hypothetical protein
LQVGSVVFIGERETYPPEPEPSMSGGFTIGFIKG